MVGLKVSIMVGETVVYSVMLWVDLMVFEMAVEKVVY